MNVRLGIELLDGARPIGRFAVPSEISGGPFTIGREGQVQVPGNDVLPVHGVMLFQDGRLFCASASSDAPIRAGNQVVPTDWVELPIPCVLRIGARVAMRPFAYNAEPNRSSVATPPPQPLPQAGPRDATRVGSPIAMPRAPMEANATPAARIAAANALRAQSGAPVRQTTLRPKKQTASTMSEHVGDDTLMRKATRRLADDWKRTSKLMKGAVAALPLVALLLMAKSSSATNNAEAMTQPYAAQLPADAPNALKMAGDPGAGGAGGGMDPAQAQQLQQAMQQVSGMPQGQQLAAGAQAMQPQQPQQPMTAPGQGTSNGHRAPLTQQERLSQKRAVDFTFAGDFAGALAIYQSLAQAHPDDLELRTAVNVIGQKSQSRR